MTNLNKLLEEEREDFRIVIMETENDNGDLIPITERATNKDLLKAILPLLIKIGNKEYTQQLGGEPMETYLRNLPTKQFIDFLKALTK